MKGHVGDTTALRVGAVRDLDSLDGTNGLDEILLSGGNSVSLPKCSCTITAIPFRLRASIVPVPGEFYVARVWKSLRASCQRAEQ